MLAPLGILAHLKTMKVERVRKSLSLNEILETSSLQQRQSARVGSQLELVRRPSWPSNIGGVCVPWRGNSTPSPPSWSAVSHLAWAARGFPGFCPCGLLLPCYSSSVAASRPMPEEEKKKKRRRQVGVVPFCGCGGARTFLVTP